MRGSVACAITVLVAAALATTGCGSDEPQIEAESGAEAHAITAAPQGRALREARWIAESQIRSALAVMEQDIRSFVEFGRPVSSLAFGDEQGWQYHCAQKLGRGGPSPTERLARVRRLAREGCDHLQRALEESLTFKAGKNPGGNTEGAARAAQRARAPLAKAQALLDAVDG